MLVDRKEKVLFANEAARTSLGLIDPGDEDKTLSQLGLEIGIELWIRENLTESFRSNSRTTSFFGSEAVGATRFWKGVFSKPFKVDGGLDVVAMSLSDSGGIETLSNVPESTMALVHPVFSSPGSHITVAGEDLVITSADKIARSLGANVGESLLSMKPPLTEELLHLIRKVMATKESTMRLGMTRNSPTGEFHIVRLMINPMKGSDGSNRVACFILNITESELEKLEPMAKGVLEERSRLRTVLGALPLGIEVVDLNRGSRERNPQFASIWGFSGSGEFPADGTLEAWEADSGVPLEPSEWPPAKSMSTGLPVAENLEIKRLDGRKAFVVVTSTPIKDHLSKTVGAITTIMDVTDLRELQVKALRQASELAKSNEELQHFAHVASHDLRQPLRAISGFMELLRLEHGESIGEDGKRYVDRAIAGAEKLQEILDDLMTLYQLDNSRSVRDKVDLADPLKGALSLLDTQLRENDAKVTIDPLPTIVGEEGQLRLLFRNLIENAIKFRRAVPLRIHISATKGQKDWTISVSDNGIGFDPIYATRIFEAFERLHTSSDYEGTGIGLAICKKIVEGHGGRIWCGSTPGVGSVFYFSVPFPNKATARKRHHESRLLDSVGTGASRP